MMEAPLDWLMEIIQLFRIAFGLKSTNFFAFVGYKNGKSEMNNGLSCISAQS